MGGCGVPGCKSRSEIDYRNGTKCFSVPCLRSNVPPRVQLKHETRRALWLSRIRRMDLMFHKEKKIKICSLHFISGKPSAPSEESSSDWAPSLLLNNAAPDQGSSVIPTAEPERGHPAGTSAAGQQYEGAQRVESQDYCPETCSQVDQQFRNESGNLNQPSISVSNAENYGGESSLALNSDSSMLQEMGCSDAMFFTEDFGNDIVEENFGVDVVNSTLLCDGDDREESLDLQTEYDGLVESSLKLRNQLTEVEVDKLELSRSLSESQTKCEDYVKKCDALEVESESFTIKQKEYESHIKDLEEKLKNANDKVHYLESKLDDATKCSLTLERLQKSDGLVSYYTGLPNYKVFNAVLKLVNAHITHSIRSLEPWQCLLFTLMRLRLGLQIKDLSYRFGVVQATGTNVFERWLYYLYLYLEPCINWTDRETLYKTMPNSFKDAFGKSVAVIIDCFEVFCERPGALDTRAMTWSNYKHHNTVKFLIGITPLGAVSFLSKGWGGRTSDKHITAHSGLCEKLLPGDVILADRGFPIGEDVGFYCARVLIPAFTHGQSQLSSHDVTDTRKIASLRVHIERVIGLVKNRFRFLKLTLHHDILDVKPGHTVAQIDEVMRVCCALTNLSAGIV